MSDPIERPSHISITRQTPVGIVHADMHITSVEISGMPGDMGDDLVGDCFDPDSCCDEHEKAMIAALRAYLRPEVAPECLLARLRDTLDRCCCEDGGLVSVMFSFTPDDLTRLRLLAPRGSLYAALRSCPETRFRLGPLSRSSASRIKRACIIKRNNKITNGSARLSLGQTRCRLL